MQNLMKSKMYCNFIISVLSCEENMCDFEDEIRTFISVVFVIHKILNVARNSYCTNVNDFHVCFRTFS